MFVPLLSQMSYIESELEALEREQEAIDLKARACEKKLRNVMNGISPSKSAGIFRLSSAWNY